MARQVRIVPAGVAERPADVQEGEFITLHELGQVGHIDQGAHARTLASCGLLADQRNLHLGPREGAVHADEAELSGYFAGQHGPVVAHSDQYVAELVGDPWSELSEPAFRMRLVASAYPSQRPQPVRPSGGNSVGARRVQLTQPRLAPDELDTRHELRLVLHGLS